MAPQDLEFNAPEGWEQSVKENPFYIFIPEFAEAENGDEFLRGRGRQVIYRVIDDEKLIYECTQCRGGISIAVIIHSKFEGSKLNHYEEQIPYCPRCESFPRSEGGVTCSIPVGSFNPKRVSL